MAASRYLPLLAASFLLHGTTSLAFSQSTIVGTLRDDATGAALVAVVVEVGGQTTQSGPSGRFELSGVSVGVQVITFRLLGYRPLRARVEVLAGDTTRYDTRLVRQPVQELDPISVTGRPSTVGIGIGREAVGERMARGFGRFIEPEELRRSEHRRVADLMRGMSGVQIVRFRECTPPGSLAPRLQRTRGARVEWPRGQVHRQPGRILLDVRDDGWQPALHFRKQHEGAGLEPRHPGLRSRYGRGLSERGRDPGEFSGAAAACGVILLWTKRAL